MSTDTPLDATFKLSPRERLVLIVIFLLGFCLLDYVRLFAINCSSRVCPRQHFYYLTIPPLPPQLRCLSRFFSIAIWNRNKVVVATAIGVWVIDVGFFLQGKSLLAYLVGGRELNSTLMLFGHRCRASKHPISITLNHVLIQSIASLCMDTCPITL